jgi:hemolysin activation/secretion protein
VNFDVSRLCCGLLSRIKGCFAVVFVLTGLLFSMDSLQASTPDAGSILRDQQPPQQLLPDRFPTSEAEKKPEPAPAPDSNVQVEVKGFRFSGYEGVATEHELQRLVAYAVGKNFSFGDLQALTEKITGYLKNKGWFLSQVYLPQQNVTSGIIEIQIVQGKSGSGMLFKRDKSVRISKRVLQSIGKEGVQPGKPLNEQLLEHAVLLMNDLPGVNARASLVRGAMPGSSEVEIAVTEGSLLSGSFFGDNTGNRYTGVAKSGGMIFINDPFGCGDQWSMMLTRATGLRDGRIGYNFPVMYNGLRGNLSCSAMHYNLGEELAAQELEGQSRSYDAGLSYPMMRSRTTTVTTTLSGSIKSLTDSNPTMDISDRCLKSATLGLNGTHYDGFFGGGYTSWSAGATVGKFHEAAAIESATTNKTEGDYTKFNLALSRMQRLTEGATFGLSMTSQFSLNNLDSSEKFSLGGPYGIRAYPVGEGSGDGGQLINATLRYNIPQLNALGSFQLVGFYDAGHVILRQVETPVSLGTATNRNRYWLQGAGVGINYSFGSSFSVKMSWARVLGDNPGRSTLGDNSDGKADLSRYWLQGSFSF